jgi:pseudouridine-5'-phosphate glycosidase
VTSIIVDTVAVAHGVRAARYADFMRMARARAREASVRLLYPLIESGALRLHEDVDHVIAVIEAPGLRKVASRDLGIAERAGTPGVLTVSACLVVARAHGLRFVATGALGGVHGDSAERVDVSADLVELARCGVNVFATGIKPIVDVPVTLDILETLGVPVIGLGGNRLPTLYANDTPYAVDGSASDATELAAMLRRRAMLGCQAGALVAVPLPAAAACRYDEVATWAASARAAVLRAGVVGAGITAAVLREMHRLGGDRLLLANESALAENISVAAIVARKSSDDSV